LWVLLSPSNLEVPLDILYSLASRFVLDLTTELAASFLTPAICTFDGALETAHSIKFGGSGHHPRRPADWSLAVSISSSSFYVSSFSLLSA
jgi:hypothetical protein